MWEWDCRNENLAKGRKSSNTRIVIMHFWLLESRLYLGHWTIVCILLTWSQTSRWISYPSLHLPPQWFRVLKIWFLSKHFLTQISALLPYMHISNSSMVASFSSSTYFIFRYGIFRCTSVLATEAEADAVATEVEVEVEVEVDASAVEEVEASKFAMERETEEEEELESELKEVLELASALLGSIVL